MVVVMATAPPSGSTTERCVVWGDSSASGPRGHLPAPGGGRLVQVLQAFPGMLPGQEPTDGHVGEVRVSQGRGPVGEGPAHALRQKVKPRRGLLPASGQLQHVQHLDEDHAPGTGRTHGDDLEAAVAAPDRRPDPGDIIGQVFPRHDPAVGLHVPLDQLGDPAPVKGVGAVPGDGLQRGRQVGLRKNPSRLKGNSVRQKNPAALVETLQERDGRFQRPAEVFLHHETAAGQVDGGLQQAAPGKRPETPPGQVEPGHGTRNPGCQVADGGQLRNHLSRGIQVQVAAGGGGGHLAIVHGDLPAGPGVVVEQESPASHVAGDGVRHSEGEAHGDGGVDGVAALSLHIHARLAGQRVGADHHPPGSDGGPRGRHLGTAGENSPTGQDKQDRDLHDTGPLPTLRRGRTVSGIHRAVRFDHQGLQ